MKMFRGHLIGLLIISIHNSACVVETVYEIGGAIWQLHLIIDQLISRAIDNADGLPSDYYVIQQIRSQMGQIHKQLDQVETFMHPKIIHDSFKSSPSSIILYKCLDTLELFVSSVDAYYEDFRQHMNETSSRSDALRQFLQSIIPNLEERIQTIRRNSIDKNEYLPDHPNLIYAITDFAMTHELELCDNPQIISHILFQLFRIVIIAEMKANIIFTIHRIYQSPLTAEKAGWMDKCNREQFERQFRAYVDLFTLHMQLTDGIYLRACDPVGGYWIRNESFYELEGTFRKAIFQYDRLKCNHESCNHAWSKNECNAHFYDVRSGCYGTLTECVDLGAMQTCVLKTGPYRFQYMNASGMSLLGRDFNCSEDNGYMIENGIDSDPTHAACLCDCHTNDNRISLSLMSSDMKSNMVITGVRFVRKNGILHMQPREGKLDAAGYVHRYSQKWVSIPKNNPYISISTVHPVNDDNRVFFLDDVSLPSGFVMTGIQFSRVIRRRITGFAIAIFGVPFDYHSGKLNFEPQSVIIRQALDEKPEQALLFRARSSIHENMPNIPSPSYFNHVSLEQSGLREDCGQSTLPFFDAIPIRTQSPSPLGGIGIFHKGIEGYAGFISLRVYGIKYAEYFTDFESRYMKNGTLFNHTCS